MELVQVDVEALFLQPKDDPFNAEENARVKDILQHNEISVSASFPYEWAGLDSPSDGIGGPPVKDAADIYFTLSSFDDIVFAYKFNLSEMIDSIIDLHCLGNIPEEGTDEDGRLISIAIAERLDTEAKRLRDFAAIKTEYDT